MKAIPPVILAAVLGGAIVGAIVWFVRPAPSAVDSTVPVESTGTDVVDSAPTPTNASQSPPPWASGANNGAASSSDLGAFLGSPLTDVKKTQARQELKNKMEALTANGRHPTPAEMNSVLGELERIEGSSIVKGVNLEAVRNNLSKAEDMQRLAEQIKAESAKPGGGDPEKIKGYMASLQKLQGEMRFDISVPTAGAPKK